MGKRTRLWLIVLVLITTACSEVAFTPAAVDGKLGDPRPIDNGEMRTDNFFVTQDRPQTKVDALFVVDNSRSMYEEQQRLANRLSSFIDSLAGVDWQIALTTTDLSGGRFSTNGEIVTLVGGSGKILTKSVANYEKVFLDTVTAHGTPIDCTEATPRNCPSGDEQPLEAIRRVIAKRNSSNAGFFRADADFVAIVLSDEDELSDGNPINSPTNAEDLVTAVRRAWGQAKRFTGFGIIIKPGDTACFNEQEASGGSYGTFVQHLADVTMGETGSICAPDYGPALAGIGQRVQRVPLTIPLSAMPTDGTVRVTFDPAQPMITWTVSGQSVVLSDLPQKGTRVEINYQTTGQR